MAQTGITLLRIERSVEAMKAEAAEDRKAWNKRWGELANKLGSVVEDIIAPGIPRIAREYFGCAEISFFAVRVFKRHAGDRSKRREFDAIAVCDDVVILNETKEYVKIAYIDEFVRFIKSGEFYGYFPEYEGKELVPIFSSLYLAEDTVNYLTKNGIYAMAMSDEAVDILNFQPVKEGRRSDDEAHG